MSEEQIEQPQEAGSSQPEMTPQEVEKLEEAKLKAKYPAMPAGPGRIGAHSTFLQKRLAKGKGQKFFDSGDYQMAKQKMGGINKPPQKVPCPIFPTGEAIPTPETVPARKTSIVKSKLTNVNVAPTNVSSNVS